MGRNGIEKMLVRSGRCRARGARCRGQKGGRFDQKAKVCWCLLRITRVGGWRERLVEATIDADGAQYGMCGICRQPGACELRFVETRAVDDAFPAGEAPR